MSKTLWEIALARYHCIRALEKVRWHFHQAALEVFIFRWTTEQAIKAPIYLQDHQEGKTIPAPPHILGSPYAEVTLLHSLPARERHDFTDLSLRSVMTLEWHWLCIDLIKLLVHSESRVLFRLGARLLYHISVRTSL